MVNGRSARSFSVSGVIDATIYDNNAVVNTRCKIYFKALPSEVSMKKLKAQTESGEIVTVDEIVEQISDSNLLQSSYIKGMPTYFFCGERMNRKGNKLISLDGEVLTILE